MWCNFLLFQDSAVSKRVWPWTGFRGSWVSCRTPAWGKCPQCDPHSVLQVAVIYMIFLMQWSAATDTVETKEKTRFAQPVCVKQHVLIFTFLDSRHSIKTSRNQLFALCGSKWCPTCPWHMAHSRSPCKELQPPPTPFQDKYTAEIAGSRLKMSQAPPWQQHTCVCLISPRLARRSNGIWYHQFKGESPPNVLFQWILFFFFVSYDSESLSFTASLASDLVSSCVPVTTITFSTYRTIYGRDLDHFCRPRRGFPSRTLAVNHGHASVLLREPGCEW